MLISEPRVILKGRDPIMSIISDGFKTVELQTGIYRVGHFGCSPFIHGYDDYGVKFEARDGLKLRGPYGVSDNVQQILDRYPELQEPQRTFFVTVTSVKKSEQPSDGGWRWHKWGEYIGTEEPQTEYLYDEPLIKEVLVFHIYEKKGEQE